MYSLEIEGKKYQLDREWTIKQWMALHKFDLEQEWMWPQIVATASGAPLDLMNRVSEETMSQAISIVATNMVPSWAELKTQIASHKLMDFTKLSIGEFVDLEVALARGLHTNLNSMIATLYSTTNQTVDSWNYEDGFAALQSWFVKRKQLLQDYEDLFESNDATDSRAPMQDPAHNWYDLLMVLADEEFLNIQYVVDRPAIEALNFLAWKKDQARKQELEQKKLMMTRR